MCRKIKEDMITIETGSLHCLSCDMYLEQMMILKPGTTHCPTCKSTKLNDAQEYYKKRIEHIQQVPYLFDKQTPSEKINDPIPWWYWTIRPPELDDYLIYVFHKNKSPIQARAFLLNLMSVVRF